MTQVTMKHVRKLKGCSSGVRQFMKRANLDYDLFLREGLPIETIRATGDAMAMKIADVAEAEANNG